MKFFYTFLVSVLFTLLQVSQAQFSVFLVNDCNNPNNGGLTRYMEIDTTLSNLNVEYSIYHTSETGTYPDLVTLSTYDVIIWYTGNDGVDLKLWDVSNPDDFKFNEPLIQYLNNGGIVWLQGLDFFYDIYSGAPDYFNSGQFIYDYMGVASYYAQSYVDDGGQGVPLLDVVQGNILCSFTPVEWVYSALWYADALEITDAAEGIYNMGPGSYIYSDYFAGLFTHPGEGHLFTMTVELARMDTQDNMDEFFGEVLSLEQF